MKEVTVTIHNSANGCYMSEEVSNKVLELIDNISYNKEQLDKLTLTKDSPNIDESVLDIAINSVIENKLYA